MAPPDRDLQIAAQLVESMAKTTSFSEFERHWQDFLYRLERSWEVALRSAKELGGVAQQWVSSNSALRKTDSLLTFLKHARHAETHAVEQTVDHDLLLSMRDRLSRPFEIESVTASLENGVLTIDVKSPNLNRDWVGGLIPGNPQLKRFKTRDGWHPPPTEHLGQKLTDLHPVAVASLGISFYRSQYASLCALRP